MSSSKALRHAPLQAAGGRALRYNRALVGLARRVWAADCDLDGVLAAICETAADVLEVERVNIWRLDAAGARLHCVHDYRRADGSHRVPGADETFEADNAYGRRLDEVRVIDAADVARDPTLSTSEGSLGAYLLRNGIRSLLDAPIRSEGRLLGVVCHEHLGEARAWAPDDLAFAGSIGDYVAMAHEVCRRRDAEKQLRYLELHDAATELPNRDHLLEVARTALCPLRDKTPGLAAIHLHVDAGDRDASDADMVAIARALQAALDGVATLARVRDDAFALLPHGHLRERDALDLAGRCIEVAQSAHGDAGSTARVLATAGIAFSHDLGVPSADALLGNAELASRRARSLGTLGRCEIYDAAHHRDLLLRLRTERALRDAFEQRRLHVHYQPVVDLQGGRWHAAEALLRWEDDDGALHGASEFIDVAEGSGLIVTLGRWVLQQACREGAGWPGQGDGTAPRVSVNVSARQFEQPGLVADVAEALAASGLHPSRLGLELTETALLADTASAAGTLGRLRALGVRISLDDFGTGYSSFNHLKHLPIDGLKLDRSFVAGLPHDRFDLAIVRAVVGLAQASGIAVVAEGVEREDQAEVLRGCGVRRAQGFLYAPALDAATIAAGFCA